MSLFFQNTKTKEFSCPLTSPFPTSGLSRTEVPEETAPPQLHAREKRQNARAARTAAAPTAGAAPLRSACREGWQLGRSPDVPGTGRDPHPRGTAPTLGPPATPARRSPAARTPSCGGERAGGNLRDSGTTAGLSAPLPTADPLTARPWPRALPL